MHDNIHDFGTREATEIIVVVRDVSIVFTEKKTAHPSARAQAYEACKGSSPLNSALTYDSRARKAAEIVVVVAGCPRGADDADGRGRWRSGGSGGGGGRPRERGQVEP